MLFAMDSLGQATEIFESKFIQRVESCQIHRHGSELIIGEDRKEMFRLTVIIATTYGVCGNGGGAAAKENPPDRIPKCGLPFLSRPAPRHSGRVCVSLATWRGKTLSLSGDMPRENSIAYPRSRPN